MKMVKSLLLGTAAGLVAMTGAQAADLPVKASPVQYVKICSLYGAGFYYIPGTDTCIKLGGWVRAEMNFNSGGSFNPYHNATLDSRHNTFETTRVRGLLTVDTRSQTEYGTLRSYIAAGWQETNNDWAGPAGSSPSFANTYAPRAFVQWAGFTAGRAQSFFDFYSTPAYSNTTNVLGSDDGGQGQTVFAYTAQFGNGLSATISAEDQTQRSTAIFNSTTGPIVQASGYAGRQWPDIAANLRIDQAWGSAQIMGAVHQVRADSDIAGQEKVGWAAGAGLTVNLPMLGKGDSFSTQFTYGKGAMNYVGSGLTNFTITSGATTAYGPVYDGVIVAGNSLELAQGWSIVAGFEHRWNPNWKTSLYGDYGKVTYDSASDLVLVGKGSADWAFWQAGSRTVWTPVANLDLSVDVLYNKIDTSAPVSGLGTGLLAESKGWWQGMFRVQRNFYP